MKKMFDTNTAKQKIFQYSNQRWQHYFNLKLVKIWAVFFAFNLNISL